MIFSQDKRVEEIMDLDDFGMLPIYYLTVFRSQLTSVIMFNLHLYHSILTYPTHPIFLAIPVS